MKIIAYPTTRTPAILRPANPKREWMDVAINKNPYRCLPLSMANSWGWEILSPAKFTAEWNGGYSPNDVKIERIEGHGFPDPYFGEGTLTWHPGYVFKTEFPYGLYVTGAPNNPKPNAIPLSGIVETHWLPFTFTMNWRFSQPGKFTMEIGEPFCQIFPIDMNMFNNVEAEIRSLHDPEIKDFHDDYWNWHYSRAEFLLKQKTSQVGPEAWQKNYFQGNYPSDGKRKCPVHMNDDGEKIISHRTKPDTPEFVDKQISPYREPEGYHETMKVMTEKYSPAVRNAVIKQPEKTKEQRVQDIENRLLELKSKLTAKRFNQIKINAPAESEPLVEQPVNPSKETDEERLKSIKLTLKNLKKT